MSQNLFKLDFNIGIAGSCSGSTYLFQDPAQGYKSPFNYIFPLQTNFLTAPFLSWSPNCAFKTKLVYDYRKSYCNLTVTIFYQDSWDIQVKNQKLVLWILLIQIDLRLICLFELKIYIVHDNFLGMKKKIRSSVPSLLMAKQFFKQVNII